MNKYKIFLELTLKKAKNRILINFSKRIEIFCIVLIFILSLLGGNLVIGNLNNNVEITERLFNKIYYAIIIPGALPFLFMEIRDKTKRHQDYIMNILFGSRWFILFENIFKFSVALIISSIYLRYMISRVNMVAVENLFLCWSSYLLIVVAISKIISLLFSLAINRLTVKIIKFEYLKKISFSFILLFGIISPMKKAVINSCRVEFSLRTIVGLSILSTIICFISIVMNIIISLKVNNIEKLYHKQRIFINSRILYIKVAYINSVTYLIFITFMMLFIHAFGLITNVSLKIDSLLHLIIMIGIPTFIIEKLDEKQLNILINLRASLYKYVISIEAIFFIITLSIMSLSVVLSIFRGDISLSELKNNIEIEFYIYSIYIAINMAVILRMVIGKSLDGVMKNIVIFVCFILSYIVIPTIGSQVQLTFLESTILFKIVMCIGIFIIKLIMVNQYELCK